MMSKTTPPSEVDENAVASAPQAAQPLVGGDGDEPLSFVRLTKEEEHARRARAHALAWVIVGLVVLFYAITVIKLGWIYQR